MQVWLLRHAEAAWNAPSDRERPLSEAGRRDAEALGAWMTRQGLQPRRVVVSPARRTQETARLVLGSAWDGQVDARLYNGSVSDLRAVLAESDVDPVLLVGHNPTVEDLAHSIDPDLPVHAGDEAVPPGTLLCFEVHPGLATGRLVHLRRVRR